MADQDEVKGSPALPGEPCQTPPHPDWTEPEKWAWQQICEGKTADFSIRYSKYIALRNNKVWTEEKERRQMSSRFLETILLHEPWRSAIPRRGVCIAGACFDTELDITNSIIPFTFSLDTCRFEDGINLLDCRFEVGLVISNTLVKGRLTMDRIKVKNILFMGRGYFQETRLLGARVNGPLDLTGATVSGKLTMDRLKVGGSLFMTDGQFKETRLVSADVTGQLSLDHATVSGELNMQGLKVGNELFLTCDLCEKEVHLLFARIDGGLFFNVDAFRSELNLTGTTVDRFVDQGGTWPHRLHLDDFTYNHLGGTHEGFKSPDMTDRPASWFIDWLARQKTYSPQPYEHCAKVLREAGRPDVANEVLYAAKNRERRLAINPIKWLWLKFKKVRTEDEKPGPGRWLWLTIMKYFVGYGLGKRYFRFPLIWAAGLTAFGALILWLWPPSTDCPSFWACVCDPNYLVKPCVFETHNIGWKILFSLDRLLPIVELSKDHNTIFFAGWYRFYFNFFQPLAGWILALLVIAGLRPAQKL
ncbi:MAG: hypothetical protein KJ621_10945 [Proteobacteria bacterium]|nr:hypothetical protein [Pseudomonadota bacterium]MBU1743126.1 hypothetical protein [Pseudomonadota bacterium]